MVVLIDTTPGGGRGGGGVYELFKLVSQMWTNFRSRSLIGDQIEKRRIGKRWQYQGCLFSISW